MELGAPICSPLRVNALVTSAGKGEHIIELVWNFLAECIIDGQLVIVHHRFKVVCPGRESITRNLALVDEFLHPA